ncbi:MaoC family dehydratase N-terminal domain-containing protein [Chloroflexota bacterium]
MVWPCNSYAYGGDIGLSETPEITDELNNLLNVEFGPEVYEIEKGMVRKFVLAIEDPNPLWQSITPPTFPAAIRIEELFQRLFMTEGSLNHVRNGTNELDYYQPIKIGDVISVTGKLAGLRKLEGKMGKTLFMIVEINYTNQDGELVARGRNTFVRY